MPQLPGAAEPQIKRFVLPTYANLPEADQAWVDMDISLMTGADMDVYDAEEEGDAAATPRVMDLTFKLLAKRIHQWNFTEPDGSGTPISAATVRRLKIKDVSYLNSLITSSNGNGLNDSAKKDLPSTSVQ